jgi:anthranilate phosphoribosyltransferase
MLEPLIQELQAGRNLSSEQIAEAVAQLADERAAPEIKATFLSALAEKGETAEEIAAFVNELRDRSIRPPLDGLRKGRAGRNCRNRDRKGPGGGSFRRTPGVLSRCRAYF